MPSYAAKANDRLTSLPSGKTQGFLAALCGRCDRILGKGNPMLVLTRHEAERIVVDVPHGNGQSTRVIVCLIAVLGNKAKIGIDAPRTVHILREELCNDFGK